MPMRPGTPATYPDIDDLMHDVGFKPATPLRKAFPASLGGYRDFYKV